MVLLHGQWLTMITPSDSKMLRMEWWKAALGMHAYIEHLMGMWLCGGF